MITLGELLEGQKKEYPACDKAGLTRNYDIYRGMTVSADDVERVINNLYLQIDNLTTAYDDNL